MPAKKTSQRPNKLDKPLSKGLRFTEKEIAALNKRATAEMKKHGFKTVEEYEAYVDSKRGY